MSDEQQERISGIPSNQYVLICKNQFEQMKLESKVNYESIMRAHDELKSGQEKNREQLNKIEQKIFNGFGESIERLGNQNKFLMGMMGSIFLMIIGVIIKLVLGG